MPKYKVLRPIEHNGKVYLPQSAESGVRGPETAIGGGHGKPVPVDSTGVIELTEAEAVPLDLGQIEKVESQKSKVKS